MYPLKKLCITFPLIRFYHRWGQIAILTALADYKPSGGKEAEGICDRVLPRLQHANGAVVLAAIKVCLSEIVM